jgi:hypothetical protein
MKYFSYDPQVGIKLHETEESAMAEAEKIFGYERDAANADGWSDEVDTICYGRVIGRAQVTETLIDDEGVERVEYGIVSV